MTASAISPDQIRALQATRRRAGISDEDWRARLGRDAGVSSTKELTSDQAGRLLDELRGPRSPVDARMQGPYAQKARALWISAYWLGVVDDRRDAALLAFVRRQTGLEALTWVRDPRDGTRVIEALKDWLAREADVDWKARPARPKEAVLIALWRRMTLAGAWTPKPVRGVRPEEISPRQAEIETFAAACGVPGAMKDWTDRDFDTLIAAGGKRLRAAMKRAAEEREG